MNYTEELIKRAKQGTKQFSPFDRKKLLDEINIGLRPYGMSITHDIVEDLSDDEMLKFIQVICNIVLYGKMFRQAEDSQKDEMYQTILEEIIANKAWFLIRYAFPIQVKGLPHYCRNAYMSCVPFIPKEQLWTTAMQIYMADGQEIDEGFIHHILNDLLPLRPSDYLAYLPKRYKKKELLTVYRTSSISHDMKTNVRYELSWVLNPQALCKYKMLREMYGDAFYFYTAQICKDKVIAYLGGADEEILQYDSVENIKEIREQDLEAHIYVHDLLQNLYSKICST